MGCAEPDDSSLSVTEAVSSLLLATTEQACISFGGAFGKRGGACETAANRAQPLDAPNIG